MNNVKECISEALATQPESYDTMESFLTANPGYEETIHNDLDYGEKVALQSYSGFRFAWINSVARGFWDYDKLGRKTPELEEEIKDSTRKIISAIEKAPKVQKDFMTFRGTDLSSFRAYGINEISELQEMKGQMMLEQGFTSTAITREKSWAGRDDMKGTLWINKPTVEIRYHIPAGADSLIALSSSELSYSPQQAEILMDHNSLFYISDVNFDKDNHAIVDAVLIPKSVYNYN